MNPERSRLYLVSVDPETLERRLRDLPSVDEVVNELDHLTHVPRELVRNEIRKVLAERRDAIRQGRPFESGPISGITEHRIRRLLTPSLRQVINATGVILHTNLGRAPLDNFRAIGGYSNLEYDLKSGKRGKRDVHTAPLLERVIGRPSVIVNNNAAAVYLVLHELACRYEAIVSRGELVEIGDGFRIPEIMAQSGVVLREVGTTNRTSIEDYRQAVNSRTRLILRVHQSNFQIRGFTARPLTRELAALGRETGIPIYEDLGSGCLIDLRSHGIFEPLVKDSIEAGINLVTFSCDKMLGGPQTGVIAGDADLVQRIRRNPMYRALRCDKLVIEALSTTLRHLILEEWDAVPTLRMLFRPVEEIRIRAERLVDRLLPLDVKAVPGESAIGGGSAPDRTLPTWRLEIAFPEPNALEQRLRKAATPVIARIERDRVVFDLRTVAPHEEEDLLAAIQTAVLDS
jgi:L-seryl-tRNA(Ser) seleniumtransferase